MHLDGKTFELAACGHVSASSQSLHFILSLRLYSSFITSRPGLKVIKDVLCPAQLSMKFILLIIVKICWHFNIYISSINTT